MCENSIMENKKRERCVYLCEYDILVGGVWSALSERRGNTIYIRVVHTGCLTQNFACSESVPGANTFLPETMMVNAKRIQTNINSR